MSSRIRDQIAARRKEVRNSPARPVRGAPTPVQMLDDKTVDGQVQRALRSGKLDLSSLSLSRFPPEAYMTLLCLPASELSRPPDPKPRHETLGTPTKPDAHLTRNFGSMHIRDGDGDEARDRVFATAPPTKFVEPEELTALRAADNRILELEPEIGLFGGLKTLDLRGNQLTALPNAIADLLQLTFIDLSDNCITEFPSSLLLLPALESVSIANNGLHTIDLRNPIRPSEEGLSYGSGFLVSYFERQARMPKHPLPALRYLKLDNNSLTTEALSGLAGKEPLKIFNITLSNNKLTGEIDADAAGLGMARMPELELVSFAGNTLLHGIKGDISPRATVETEGCGWGVAAIGQQSVPAPSSTDGDEPKALYTPAPGGPTDVPEPSTTVTFITHPSVSFEAEPLPLQMDVYLPPDAKTSSTPHPVVIWWHGGGLLQGNKENLPPHLRRLPSRPLGKNGDHAIVISPNYRLAPQAPILDILADVDSAISYTRTKLNDKLASLGYAARVDPSRIVLSGGSAGGYLALMGGLPVPSSATDAELGGYRGPAALDSSWTPRGIAPFYPITDLTHEFWATETNPVPWWGTTVPHASAKPHLNPRDPPIGSAVSGGPRSILYMYMLQHALFPSLLFQNQRSRASGLDGYRPNPETLSVTTRLRQIADAGLSRPPVYLVYGTVDDKVQPLEESADLIRATKGDTVVEVIKGADHAFDEKPAEQCAAFVEWLEECI